MGSTTIRYDDVGRSVRSGTRVGEGDEKHVSIDERRTIDWVELSRMRHFPADRQTGLRDPMTVWDGVYCSQWLFYLYNHHGGTTDNRQMTTTTTVELPYSSSSNTATDTNDNTTRHCQIEVKKLIQWTVAESLFPSSNNRAMLSSDDNRH